MFNAAIRRYCNNSSRNISGRGIIPICAAIKEWARSHKIKIKNAINKFCFCLVWLFSKIAARRGIVYITSVFYPALIAAAKIKITVIV